MHKSVKIEKSLISKAQTDINASADQVWDALVNPDKIRQYMFGTNVVSDWKEGAGIVWKGEWEGKSYEDKGVIQKIQPQRLLQYSHFSPLSGQPDVPENYHTVTVELAPQGERTRVTLSQDKNASEEEKAHSEKNWQMMLDGLKKFTEG
jgi:uncharacterized protein YndB with AHSA1/START domain